MKEYRGFGRNCQADSGGPDSDEGRKIHPGALGAGLLLGGLLWAAGTRGYAWLATHPVRVPVRLPPNETIDLEEVEFPARDGVKISGWFAPAPDAVGAVILCHGHPMNRMEMLPWARLLHTAGFHTLMFDFRAMGRSEGDLCTIGRHEVNDLLGATDYLVEHPEMQTRPNCKPDGSPNGSPGGLSIGVYGISMGGAVSIMAAAQEERIRAVATHGAYASLHRAIHQRGRMLLGPGGPLLAASAIYWGRRWLQIDPRSVSPLDMISRVAPRPVLIIHGRKDRIVNPADAHALYAAAGTPKLLHILPHSWHVRINTKDRADYDRLLASFFLEALIPDRF